jgi:hypothetical protein
LRVVVFSLALLVTLGDVQAANPASFGVCGFGTETNRFEATAADEVACLLYAVKPRGTGATPTAADPDWLATRVGGLVPVMRLPLANTAASVQADH